MASGVEIGVGFISIIPEMSGFRGAFDKELGKVGKSADSAGKSSGGFFSRAMSTAVGIGLAKVGATAAGALTKPISAGFKGAWNRLTSIEEAQATLGTIYKGNDAMVKAAMSSVDTAVTGTRFAISEAADMAAQLGASGVEGEKMTRWLTLTADAAQVTNSNFTDMQPLMQEIAATGRVTGEHLNRFPLAASALADNLGISQAEVRKLASEGKITSDQFAEALEGKIGGAAQNAGATLSSMIANIKTNWSALFADLLGPLLGALKPVAGIVLGTIQGLRDGITKPFGELLQSMLGPWSENMTKMFDPKSVRESVGNWSRGIGEHMTTVVNGLKGVWAIFAEGDFKGPELTFGLEEDSPVVGFLFKIREAFISVQSAVAGFIAGFGGMDTLIKALGGILPLLTGPLGILRTVLGDVFSGGATDARAFGESIGQVIGPLVFTLGDLAQAITGALGQALAAVLPVLLTSFQQLVPVIGQVASALAPLVAGLIQELAPILGQLITTLLPVIADLFVQWVPLVLQLVSAIAPLVATLLTQLAPVLLQIITTLLPPLMSLFAALVPVIMAVVNALHPIITTLVNLLAPILVTLVQALLPPLAQVLAVVANVISTVVLPILAVVINVLGVVFAGIIRALVPIIGTVFGYIADTIGNVMNFVSGVINIVLGVISGDWSRVWEGIKLVFGAIWDQIKNIVTTAITLVWNIITGVLGLIATAWSAIWEVIKAAGLAIWTWIVNTATRLFNSLKDGITFIFTAVRDFFVNIWNNIRDWVLERITALVDRGRTAFDDFKTKVEEIFTRLRDRVGEIWEGIQEKVKAPIRFVVNTVLNDGLIDNINKLLEKFSVPTIPRITLPQGFEKGGATPNVGDRRVAGVVHGNEHVWTAREVRALPGGHATLYRMRELALARKLEANFPGFFLGGHVPVPGGRVTNRHPHPYYNSRWAGDFAMPMGTPVYAWRDGAIASTARWGHSYGSHIRINHGEFGQSLYAHLSQIAVAAGQMVRAGQRIGAVGSTGNSSGPHLHFEILGGNSPLSGDSGGSGFASFLVSQVADTLTEPVRKLIDSIPGEGFVSELVKAIGKDLLDKAVNWVISKIPGHDDSTGSSVSSPAGVEQWRSTVLQALSILGLPTSLVNITLRRMNQESSGRANAINLWDSNARAGIPSKGLMQVIDPTFRTYAHPAYNRNIYDPLSNILASMRYAIARYGSLPSAYNRPGGYWAGTISASPGWHWVGERGPELINLRGGERITPHGKSKEITSPRGNTQIIYAPVLTDADPERQYEDFAWKITQEAGL